MALVELLPSASFLLIVISGLVCYFTGLIIYRLFLDPLAQFPGPKLAVITRYYEAYYDVIQGGQYTFKIEQLHRKYGPIVRISPYELHVKDPTFFSQLYRQEGIWEKYEWMQRGFAAGPRSSFITAPHDIHRRRRAPLDLFFSKRNVARRQDIVRACVNKLHQRINDAATKGNVFDLGDALAATGTDISTAYIFGKSFNNLDKPDFNMPMINMIRSHGAMWRTTKHITFLGPILLRMPLSVLEMLPGDDIKAFVAFLRNNTAQVKAEMAKITTSEDEDDDSFDTMVQSILKSRHLPPSEKEFGRINDEVDSVKGAGIESASQTLRLTCFYIYNNPKILQSLRQELAGVAKYLGPTAVSSDDTPVLLRLERLPYLTAVVKEGLRMSPAIATRMSRIAPDREIVYGSKIIPAGTPVGMTVLLMHYDEKQYPEPYTFDPRRWLDSADSKQRDSVFAPFSRGTRMCVGMHLAYAELYLIIATLVTSFDIDLINAKAEDIMPNHDSFVIGTKEKHGPKARAHLLS